MACPVVPGRVHVVGVDTIASPVGWTQRPRPKPKDMTNGFNLGAPLDTELLVLVKVIVVGLTFPLGSRPCGLGPGPGGR